MMIVLWWKERCWKWGRHGLMLLLLLKIKHFPFHFAIKIYSNLFLFLNVQNWSMLYDQSRELYVPAN
jgi:hypothetical protein